MLSSKWLAEVQHVLFRPHFSTRMQFDLVHDKEGLNGQVLAVVKVR